ncbi:MAG: GNAT family N-acetyltransferase, partial [Gammaproteobacteria bacterium]
DALQALSVYLSSHKLVIEFTRVKTASILIGRLVSKLNNEGWFSSQMIMGVCPYIDLSNHSWDSYLATLGAAHRANVRRRLRAVSKRFQVDFEQADSESQRRHCFQSFVDLHRQRWKQRDDIDEMDVPGMWEFHAELSSTALQLGWLRLFTLSLDGKPAASIYAFRYNDVFYFYQSGFDPNFSKHSVGLVTMGLAIKSAIEERAIEYDLLHGDEDYKFLWAHSGRDLMKLNCYPPTAAGLLCRQAMDLRIGIKKLMRWPRQLLAT